MDGLIHPAPSYYNFDLVFCRVVDPGVFLPDPDLDLEQKKGTIKNFFSSVCEAM